MVENKPGATGNIATEYVINQPPDGYTILVTTTANAINMTFLQKLAINFLRDMEPVAGLASFTYLMLVNPGVPAKSVPEFIAYAKANPGKINFASGGVGSSNQLAAELFKVDDRHRSGARALSRQRGGLRRSASAATSSSSSPTSPPGGRTRSPARCARSASRRRQRLATLPDVPAIAETVPGYEANGWYGFAAPKGTPRRRDREAQRRDQCAGSPIRSLRRASRSLRRGRSSSRRQEYGAFLVSESERWGKAVKASGVRGD